MSTSTALFDAVAALNNKIKNAAPTATAEELAYLGSAIEKIGGQVSLLDLAEHVNNLKTILDNYRLQIESELRSSVTGIESIAQNDLNGIKDSHIVELAISKGNAIAEINASQQAASNTVAILAVQTTSVIANLTAAITQASEAAAAIGAVQPISEAELFFYRS